MLQAIIDDPSPGPSVGKEVPSTPGTESALANDARNGLRQILVERYDSRNRGWGTIQKFLDADIIEYSMNEAQRGDERFERMAREALSAELQLMDPAWGGVYQYSTDGDWRHPHFEKIMQRQADDLRIYANAYASDVGVAFYISLLSVTLGRPIGAQLVVLGQMSLHGVLSRVDGLGDKPRRCRRGPRLALQRFFHL